MKRTKSIRRIKDNKGFLKSNKSNFTPFKIIEGNNITMEGVEFPILAIGLDNNGNILDKRVLNTNDNFTFSKADRVLEIPLNNIKAQEAGFNNQNKRERRTAKIFPQEENEQRSNRVDTFNPFSNLETSPTETSTTETSTTETLIPIENENTTTTETNSEAVNTSNNENNPNISQNKTVDVNPFSDFLSGITDKLDTLDPNSLRGVGTVNEKKDKTEEEENKNKTQFNPFGGIDIPTSAFLFGQSLGTERSAKNTGLAISSGLKTLLGLGRNIASGIGFGKRNQEALNEAQRQERINQTKIKEFRQEGGTLSQEEKQEIRDITEIPFTDSTIDELFSKVQPVVKSTTKRNIVDLGKFKSVPNFFEIQDLGDRVRIFPGERNFRNADQFKEDLIFLQKINPDIKIADIETGGTFRTLQERKTKLFQQGGENENEEENSLIKEQESQIEQLTGNESEGVDEGTPSNVELEEGEFFKTPNSTPVKVLGKEHKDGGEDFNLEKGTKIISNFTKIPKDKLKEIQEVTGIKVSDKDTYAKVLDKFNEKIGLNKLIEEEKKLIKQLDKLLDTSKDRTKTNDINIEFISNKINDIQKEKNKLEKESANTFDFLFDVQEQEKEKSVQEENNLNISEEMLSSLSEALKIPQEELRLKLGGKISAKTGTEVGDAEPKGILTEKQKETSKKIFDYLTEVKGVAPHIASGIIGNLFKESGLNPKAFNPDDKGEPSFGLAQWRGTRLDNLKKFARDKINDIETQLDFLVHELNTSQKEASKLLQETTNAEDAALVFSKKFEVPQESTAGNDVRSQVAVEVASLNGLPEESKRAQVREKQDNIDSTVLRRNAGEELQKTLNFKEVEIKDLNRKNNTEDTGEKDTNSDFLFPDNGLLPPQGIILPTRVETNLSRINPQLRTPDALIAEIIRGVSSAFKQIENLPTAQREAAIAQIQSNAQDQINKAITETENFNKATLQNTEVANAGQRDKEEQLRVANLNNFENQVFQAQANTEDDFRRFFNESQQRNIQKFNFLSSINLLNQSSDNFDFTGNGVENTVGADITKEDILDLIKNSINLGNNAQQEKTTNSADKKSNKIGGEVRGKFKRKNI